MAIVDSKLRNEGRRLARALRREGRNDEAQTVDSLLDASAKLETSLLTTGQVAKRVGVSRQTVVNWVRRGVLPGVRLGGRTMIPASALARFARLESILDELDAQRAPLSAEEAANCARTARRCKRWATIRTAAPRASREPRRTAPFEGASVLVWPWG